MKSYILPALFFFITPFLTYSQDLDYYLPDDVTFDETIPTPAGVIGHEVGEWHVTHDKLVHYMYELAEASDRVTIKEFGKTYEDRPLLLLTITSPENQSSIETIKENQHLLTDPDRSENMDISDMPVIIHMGFSIHGNEPSGSNASLLTAYHLAAAQGDEIEEQLQNAVILFDPSFNPDGLNRFASWANMHKSHTSVTDPATREFSEAWPGGRTNHYWFDLNRDWMPAQHPESRGRLGNFHEWKPNVLTDHHEMGTSSTFFFQPGIPSRTHPLTPQQNQDLTSAIGEYHAEALDDIQSLYFTKESYDDFYYGKGSTYPDIFGAVGILFEQASSRGHAQESDNGVLTFPFTIKNQFVTTLSTLKASVALREELHNHMRSFYSNVQREAARSSVKAIVVGDAKDRGKNFHFADLLSHHDVDFYELGQDLQANGEEFSEGMGYVIPTEQNQYKFIEAIFEERTEFRDSLFYDVSAWTLPHAFNMPYAELSQNEFSENLLGQKIDVPEKPQGQIVGGRSQYAYAFNWDEYYAPRALYRLQELGVEAKVAAKPFRASTTTGVADFDYGAILIPLGIQEDVDETELFRALQKSATEDGVTFYSMRTGLSVGGIDLGSRNMNTVEKPSVAVLAGDGVRSLEVGQIWHQMDQRYQIPLTILEKDRVSSTDLSRYNSIVLASGSYGSLSNNAVSDLKQWTREGGTLIVQRTAISWAINQGLVKAERVEVDSSETDDDETIPYVDLQATRGAQRLGGAIFSSILDVTHPLGYGFKNSEMYSFRNSTNFLKKADNPFATPLYLTDEPLASGYISDENLEKAGGSASIIVSRYGSGRVIAFVDNPNFRAFWFGTNKLFANAIFFGNTISSGAAE